MYCPTSICPNEKCLKAHLNEFQSVVDCQCGQLHLAIPVSRLYEKDIVGDRFSIKISYCQYMEGCSSLLVKHEGWGLYKLCSPKRFVDGSCGEINCLVGSPYVMARKQSDISMLDSDKDDRVLIFPVVTADKPVLHGTNRSNLPGIIAHGLLPYCEHNSPTQGYPAAEKWLRFAGGWKAAKWHARSWSEPVVLPIQYSGLILKACGWIYPWVMFKLFDLMPTKIECIHFDEDGESYAFRRGIPLMIHPEYLKKYKRYVQIKKRRALAIGLRKILFGV